MPRFWDITVFLVCVSLGIGLINGMAIGFNQQYMTQPATSSPFTLSDVRSQAQSGSAASSPLDATIAAIWWII